MHHETPDKYAVLLAAGHFKLEVGDSWREVHDGLRDEVIRTVLASEHAIAVRKAVRQRRPIRFQDNERGLVLRWTPCGVS
jgi:hypothetical protein